MQTFAPGLPQINHLMAWDNPPCHTDPFDGKIMMEVLRETKRLYSNEFKNIYIYVNPRHDFIFQLNGLKRIKVINNGNYNKVIHIYEG